jgi:hypothetical protein
MTSISTAMTPPPERPSRANERSKFYDFADQVIDGEIRRPTALYTNARSKAQFERLLRLKKSFLAPLFDTAKERVFK